MTVGTTAVFASHSPGCRVHFQFVELGMFMIYEPCMFPGGRHEACLARDDVLVFRESRNVERSSLEYCNHQSVKSVSTPTRESGLSGKGYR